MRGRYVHPNEEAYLGPVAIAVFIEKGWIREWPMVWTDRGRVALRNGHGRWHGTKQLLPIDVPLIEGGAAHWEGRLTSIR